MPVGVAPVRPARLLTDPSSVSREWIAAAHEDGVLVARGGVRGDAEVRLVVETRIRVCPPSTVQDGGPCGETAGFELIDAVLDRMALAGVSLSNFSGLRQLRGRGSAGCAHSRRDRVVAARAGTSCGGPRWSTFSDLHSSRHFTTAGSADKPRPGLAPRHRRRSRCGSGRRRIRPAAAETPRRTPRRTPRPGSTRRE